jgi:hypothetical protein
MPAPFGETTLARGIGRGPTTLAAFDAALLDPRRGQLQPDRPVVGDSAWQLHRASALSHAGARISPESLHGDVADAQGQPEH